MTQRHQNTEISMNLPIPITLSLEEEIVQKNWVILGTQWVKGNPLMKSHIPNDKKSKELL